MTSSLSSHKSGTSSTRSAGDSNFKWMEGRKYHDVAGSSYCLSSDEEELDRMAMQHYMIKTIFNGTNFGAPVNEILELDAKVLDVGCASASWAMDVATEFRHSRVIGIDMVPVFPTAIKPENCTFTLANILHGLPFQDNTFDFIHMRFLVYGLRKEDWPMVLSELYRVCRFGGYCEFCEFDMMPRNLGPICRNLFERINMACDARGQYPNITNDLRELMKDAGFIDVESTMMSCPIGPWGGGIGRTEKENLSTGISSGKALWTAAWGWTGDQFDERLSEAMNECDKREAFVNCHRFWGRKPE